MSECEPRLTGPQYYPVEGSGKYCFICIRVPWKAVNYACLSCCAECTI